MIKGQNLVDAIDPSLEFTKDMGGACTVYKVRENGLDYTLKVSQHPASSKFPNRFRWTYNHLRKERRILGIVDGIPGVTHLVRDYGDGDYWSAILKEYKEGKHSFITNTELQVQLEDTLRQIHNLGVAGLDIGLLNIVTPPDDSLATFVDLGAGANFKKFNPLFSAYIKIDRISLNSLFR